MEPIFLDLDEILVIHKDQVQRYGGSEGIRDAGLLESAIAAPMASFAGRYLHSDLLEMAAAYLFHIAGNHPFVDGNKRTGAAAALVFMELNGISLSASEEDLEQLVWGVARGDASKESVAAFFREHAQT